ncbi:MAG: hypothetical protein ABSG89_11400 [Bacteroidales bacterium]|jgi:SecD/SecF fusion protein
MKIKSSSASGLLALAIIAGGCSLNSKFDLKMKIEPLGKNITVTPENLKSAAAIIKKRLNCLGIPDKSLKIEVSQGCINLDLSKFDTSNTEIVEKLVTVPGKIAFWETYENKDVIGYLNKANKILADHKIVTYSPEAEEPAAQKQPQETPAGGPSPEDMLKTTTEATNNQKSRDFRIKNPLFGILEPMVSRDGEPMPSCLIGLADARDTSKVNSMIRMKEIKDILPHDLKFAWGRYPYRFDKSKYELIAIKDSAGDGRAPLEGDVIISAKAEIKGSNIRLGFSMNPEGAAVWSGMIRNNLNHCIAVTIDGYVRSYPRVMTEIKSGNTEITGDFTDSEARYLADIFNSGGSGLPVRLRVAEEKMAMK